MNPPSWNTSVDSSTLDAAWQGIGRKRVHARRVRRAKVIAAPIVSAALALLVLFVTQAFHRPSKVVEPLPAIALQSGAPLPTAWEAPSTSNEINLDDGSHLLLSKGARLTAAPSQDPARVDLVLENGDVTFDIKPGGPRAWVIDAGNGTRVRVLGTRFTVTRDARHVHVAVARGKVRVESSRVARDLVAGDEQDVPVERAPANDAVPPTTTTTQASPPAIAPVPVENLSAPAAPSAKRSVRKASSNAAAEEPAPSPPPPPPPPPPPTTTKTDRFAEADAARKAGNPREAVTILKSAVDNNDRAALAAFTIGKIHAEELSEPAAAATWFDRAIRLGLPGGLEEDAYARVVECHGQAGRAADASRAAERYEAKFPSGRHLARVQRWKR